MYTEQVFQNHFFFSASISESFLKTKKQNLKDDQFCVCLSVVSSNVDIWHISEIEEEPHYPLIECMKCTSLHISVTKSRIERMEREASILIIREMSLNKNIPLVRALTG